MLCVHEVEHWARDAQLRNFLFIRDHQKQLCVASPVLQFVDTSANELLTPNQFAYRKGLGAAGALSLFSHKIQTAFDDGNEVRAVSLDLVPLLTG